MGQKESWCVWDRWGYRTEGITVYGTEGVMMYVGQRGVGGVAFGTCQSGNSLWDNWGYVLWGGAGHSLLDRRVGVKAKHFRQFSAHVNRCFMGLAHREAIHVISPRLDHLQFCIPRPNNSLHDDTGRWPASQTSLAFDPL